MQRGTKGRMNQTKNGRWIQESNGGERECAKPRKKKCEGRKEELGRMKINEGMDR